MPEWAKKGIERGPPESGNFLNIIEGMTYVLMFKDIEDKDQGKDLPGKDMNGNDKIKYRFHVALESTKIDEGFEDIVENCLQKFPKKRKFIEKIENKYGEEFIWDMSPTCQFKLSEFVEKEDLKDGVPFKFKRVGNNSFLFNNIKPKKTTK